jgi:hypothetical protein
MVGLEVEAVRTAGKLAGPITLQERPLHRARDRASLAADGERRAMLVLDDLDHAAVAAQAASRLRGDAGAVREARHVAGIRDLRGRGRDRARVRGRGGGLPAQGLGGHAEDELDRRSIGTVATEVALRDLDQGIGAIEGRAGGRRRDRDRGRD